MNIDFEEGVLRWVDSKTGQLEKPMTSEARRLLEAADRIVGVDWVCPSPSFQRMRIETLEEGFERAMKNASVVADENATLHLIGHWFATKIYTDSSIDLPTQMALLGHRSVAAAMRYAHVTRKHVRQAAEDAAKRRAAAIRAAGKRGKVWPLPGRRT